MCRRGARKDSPLTELNSNQILKVNKRELLLQCCGSVSFWYGSGTDPDLIFLWFWLIFMEIFHDFGLFFATWIRIRNTAFNEGFSYRNIDWGLTDARKFSQIFQIRPDFISKLCRGKLGPTCFFYFGRIFIWQPWTNVTINAIKEIFITGKYFLIEIFW